MEVHSNLGPGFLESVYESAMAIELNLRNVPYERQKAIPVMYKGEKARDFACDFLVGGKVLGLIINIRWVMKALMLL
jgi:GxxExxY protein